MNEPTTFWRDAESEVILARRKFPAPDGLMTALTEEVGELAKALMDDSWDRVVEEALQVAAMARRLAEEGDPTLARLRASRGANRGPGNALPRAMWPADD